MVLMILRLKTLITMKKGSGFPVLVLTGIKRIYYFVDSAIRI